MNIPRKLKENVFRESSCLREKASSGDLKVFCGLRTEERKKTLYVQVKWREHLEMQSPGSGGSR